ncbi:MAG: beta-propeller domain-containing protein [Deltaproteobacteria bacterium]|nr:beta-propeller domain-containing protein [Deltaproteobacteria bacterium]
MDSGVAGQDATTDGGLSDAMRGGVAPLRAATLVPFGSEEAYRAYVARMQRATDDYWAWQRAAMVELLRENQARDALDEKWTQGAQRGAQRRPIAGEPYVRRRYVPPSNEGSVQHYPYPGERSRAARIVSAQEDGTDEGDIFKTRGNDLVVLRRGRLFSMRMEGDRVVPRSMLAVSPPGVLPAEYYDEILIEGDTVVVIGTSWIRQATEVSRFALSQDGTLSYRDTLLLRNGNVSPEVPYPSRIIGNRLVMHREIPAIAFPFRAIGADEERSIVNTPAWRTLDGEWQTSADWTELYRPTRNVGMNAVLHVVHECELGMPALRCRTRGVLSTRAQGVYMTDHAAYVWTVSHPSDANVDDNDNANEPDRLGDAGADDAEADGADRTSESRESEEDKVNVGSVVYRFPLGEGTVGAVVAAGSPIDPMSFREQGDRLQVLVSPDRRGGWLWPSNLRQGEIALALVQIPVSFFTREGRVVAPSMLHALPAPARATTLANRFVGDRLLYGSDEGGRARGRLPTSFTLYAHHLQSHVTQAVMLGHPVEYIGAMGRDVWVTGGGDQALYVSTVTLGETPALRGSYVHNHAHQPQPLPLPGYRPEGEGRGLLGVPILVFNWADFAHPPFSQELLFLRVDPQGIRRAGSFVATPPRADRDDRCLGSCMDWRGAGSPIYWQGRVFALMGYELIEGTLSGNTLREVRRTNFYESLAPAVAPR